MRSRSRRCARIASEVDKVTEINLLGSQHPHPRTKSDSTGNLDFPANSNHESDSLLEATPDKLDSTFLDFRCALGTVRLAEVKQIEAELLNMDRQMEMLERDHRVHIKVHEQKVQNLEYEHKNSRKQVQLDGEMSVQKEKELHTEHGANMNKDKQEIKRELRERQLENEDD
eukprot:408274-Amphidinium_carterae.1